MSRATDEQFMRLAFEKAKEGIENGQTPFGSCIVKDGAVVACAHNVVWLTTDITAHAEVNAIRQACKALGTIDLKGCVLYSTCEPCPMCFSAIHWAKIDRVVFGARIEDAQTAGFSELSIANETMKKLGGSPVQIDADFDRAANASLFTMWLNRSDRRVY
jgi:tRNA(Arg) A34 adenosine deaminase TadA